MSRTLCPKKNKPSQDKIYTPRPLAKQIVDHFAPSGRILEPCYGDGAFIEALAPYASSLHGCELEDQIDYFEWRSKDRYDWIVTNFPFSKYKDFLKKSMNDANQIISFGTINHILALKARLRLVKEYNFGIKEVLLTETPKGWSTGGFQCGAIHLQRYYHGDCKFSNL